jgi:hypothetical protein
MLSVQVLRAHTLDILAAKVRIVEAELTLEEKEVRLENGTSFMAEPNLNCKIAVVKTSSNQACMRGRGSMIGSS